MVEPWRMPSPRGGRYRNAGRETRDALERSVYASIVSRPAFCKCKKWPKATELKALRMTENYAQIPVEPIWVDSNDQLAELCERWRQQAAIAIDTEFMRTSTFYPQTALLQVGDGRGCYLIDPIAIDQFDPLVELLADEQVTKVLHSCSEDLEVFQCFFGVVPKPLFDTQIAAAIAGHGFSLGYAKLVDVMLGIAVPKSETRSDWLQRPLSQAQLQYAAIDVAYLLVIYGKLLQQLKGQQRLSWVLEDCAALVEAAEVEPDFDEYYVKIKSAWKLNRSQLSSLQQLAAWREYHARDEDVPRNRLIKERAVFDLARLQPTDIAQLYKLEGLPSKVVKASGETLLEIIADSKRIPDSMKPALLPRPLPPEVGDQLKALKQIVRDIAEQLQLPIEVLVRKKEYETLIRNRMADEPLELPGRLNGWRKSVVGESLLNYLNS
jgi:ribonuclease D